MTSILMDSGERKLYVLYTNEEDDYSEWIHVNEIEPLSKIFDGQSIGWDEYEKMSVALCAKNLQYNIDKEILKELVNTATQDHSLLSQETLEEWKVT